MKKRFSKVILITIFTLIFFYMFFNIAFSAQLFTLTGTVRDIYRGVIVVKADDGRVISFRVGFRTRYYPRRYPVPGERVRVEYFMRGPTYIGYIFHILGRPSSRITPRSPYIAYKENITMTVIVNRANVRIAPTISSNIIDSLQYGDEVIAIGEKGKWQQVKLPDGRIGWIYKPLLKKVPVVEAKPLPTQQPAPLQPTTQQPAPLQPTTQQPIASQPPVSQSSRQSLYTKPQQVQEENIKTEEKQQPPYTPQSTTGQQEAKETTAPVVPQQQPLSKEVAPSTPVLSTKAETSTSTSQTSVAGKHVELADSREPFKIKAKPDESSQTILEAQPGEQFLLLGQEGDWYKIKTSKGPGYILKKNCTLLP